MRLRHEDEKVNERNKKHGRDGRVFSVLFNFERSSTLSVTGNVICTLCCDARNTVAVSTNGVAGRAYFDRVSNCVAVIKQEGDSRSERQSAWRTAAV